MNICVLDHVFVGASVVVGHSVNVVANCFLKVDEVYSG